MELASLRRAVLSFVRMLPILVPTLMLVSMLVVLVPPSLYRRVFTGNPFVDPLVGDAVGSVSAGNPAVSYIIGGELLRSGVSLLAVTAFIVAWVTVGLVQLPAEATALGTRFAVLRNALSFILAIFVALLTCSILGWFG